MAFINEWVEENDEREFTIPGYKKYVPTKWTIDRERNIILFAYFRGSEYLLSASSPFLVFNLSRLSTSISPCSGAYTAYKE